VPRSGGTELLPPLTTGRLSKGKGTDYSNESSDVPDESEFLRSSRSVWLEIKSDNVEETSRKILESGPVRKLNVPDFHLYFQAPGGQCLRLVGINEDLSFYEGAGEGPDVAKVKGALRNEE